MEELNERLAIREERLAIREERIATRKAVMDGDIRPHINQFWRGAEARVFLTPLALNTIQSYLPGQNLDHFRKPENRLSIFRSGLIEVLRRLNITSFTREEVFVALRANQTKCLNYMAGVHLTMVQDHSMTYTSDDIILQLWSNEPARILKYMHRLDPTMFADEGRQLDCYTELLRGHPWPHLPHRTVRNATKNFTDTFKLLNLHIGVMIPESFLADMAMFRDSSIPNHLINAVLNVIISENPSQIDRLVPDNMEDLEAVYEILRPTRRGYRRERARADMQTRDLINNHVLRLRDDPVPRIVRNHFRQRRMQNLDFNPLEPREERDVNLYVNLLEEIVLEDNSERVIQVLNAIPLRLKQMTRHLIDFAQNAGLRQRLTDHADNREGISANPSATRPAPPSDAGFFLFSYA
jgi:hypothetical protein